MKFNNQCFIIPNTNNIIKLILLLQNYDDLILIKIIIKFKLKANLHNIICAQAITSIKILVIRVQIKILERVHIDMIYQKLNFEYLCYLYRNLKYN